jgi:cytochrome oxidase Cu insertion factor (SCO1/SenC/PrrC family)
METRRFEPLWMRDLTCVCPNINTPSLSLIKTKEGGIMIALGGKAPDFCLTSGDGDEVCLKNLKGKWVVLFFYVKDNTSG